MENSGDVSQGVVVGVCRILALCYETYEPDIFGKRSSFRSVKLESRM